jgi:hypothetical protein
MDTRLPQKVHKQKTCQTPRKWMLQVIVVVIEYKISHLFAVTKFDRG